LTSMVLEIGILVGNISGNKKYYLYNPSLYMMWL
jgi:hypothetical protein